MSSNNVIDITSHHRITKWREEVRRIQQAAIERKGKRKFKCDWNGFDVYERCSRCAGLPSRSPKAPRS